MRRPYTHTFDVSERLDHFFVTQAGQAGKINFTADCVLRQIANVAELLPRNSRPPHLSDAQVLDGLRRQLPARSFFQPAVNSGGGFGAQLLKDDGARQHFKTGLAVGHLAWPDPGNNRSKDDIGFRKMVNGLFHG